MRKLSLSVTLVLILFFGLIAVPIKAQDSKFAGEFVFSKPRQSTRAINAIENSLSSTNLALNSISDTFVSSGYPDANFEGYYNTSTPPVHILLVGDNTNTGHQRLLLKFDLSSIPKGSTIISADLRLFLAGYWLPGPTINITSYRITSDWQSTTTTWNTAPHTGESYDVTSVGTQFQLYDWDIASLSQKWVDSTYPNYGLMLKGPENGNQDLKAFASNEESGLEPVLLVQYFAPGENEHVRTELKMDWASGIISDGVGSAGIMVADLNKDGINDVITSTNSSVYVLNKVGGNDYDTLFFSDKIFPTALAVGDGNEDGVLEIYAGTANSVIHVYSGDTFEELPPIFLDAGLPINGIQISDVDGDNNPELVVVRSDATFFFGAKDLTLKWKAVDKGGIGLDIGNIDGDSQPEVIVNSNPAHVLDAKNKTEKWAYSGGFGKQMSLGDVDGDDLSEIAYIENWDNVYVLKGQTATVIWHLQNLGDLARVDIADVNGDGSAEVLVGNGQWGLVTGYRGIDGTKLWGISNPEHGVSGIGVGDTNNDGIKEVLWGAGLTSTGKDVLFIGSWVSQSVLWGSPDLDGPIYVASSDVDNDSQEEIVIASRSSNSGYEGGTIRVYDAKTHKLEWSTQVSNSFYDLNELAVGQLDTDSALEIVVGGNNWYSTRLQVYDGLTKNLEWQSPVLASDEPHGLLVQNIDNDPLDEIIVGLGNGHIEIFNGASNLIQWDSGVLNGTINDMTIGDLDGDGNLELIALTDQGFYIFRVGTWTQLQYKPLISGSQVAIYHAGSNPPELLIAVSEGTSTKIMSLNGLNYTQIWEHTLRDTSVSDLRTSFIDSDGDQEIILLGNKNSDPSSSVLKIASIIESSMWTEFDSPGKWGRLTGMSLLKADQYGSFNILTGSDTAFEVYNIQGANVVPSKIAIITAAQTISAGLSSNDFSVQIQDAASNPVVAIAPMDLNLSSSSSSGKFDINANGLFDGSITKVTIPTGSNSASFYYKDTTPGTPIISVSGTGLVSGTQQETITAGPLDHIAVSPTNPFVGVSANQTFTAHGYDLYNNSVDGLTFVWSVINPVAGSINSSGVLTAGTTPGLYANVIKATSAGKTGLASVTIVMPGTPAKLVFSIQPSTNNLAGKNLEIQPLISIQDAAGITVSTYNSPVTIAITSGTGTVGAIVSGNVTVNAVNGLTTFSNLKIDKAGTNYTLTANSGNLTSAISQNFKVVNSGDANLDGILNMADVTKVERIILGLDPVTCSCDANKDGLTNMGDVTKVERFILGLDPLEG